MQDMLSDLRLDGASIRRDLGMCRGIARAYRAKAEQADLNTPTLETYVGFAATNFRRAGAHALLLDETSAARSLFRQAAAEYRRLLMPYAAMMSTLASGFADDVTTLFEQFAEHLHEPFGLRGERQHQYAYLLLAGAGHEVRMDRALGSLFSELEAFQNVPVGVLGIPVGAYLDLTKALQLPETPLAEALAPFLAAYDTAIRRASVNTHHWRTVSLPFHPAEPDILSVLRLVHARRSVFGALDRFPLAGPSRAILTDGLHQLLRTD
jgi:hypothetical protein